MKGSALMRILVVAFMDFSQRDTIPALQRAFKSGKHTAIVRPRSSFDFFSWEMSLARTAIVRSASDFELSSQRSATPWSMLEGVLKGQKSTQSCQTQFSFFNLVFPERSLARTNMFSLTFDFFRRLQPARHHRLPEYMIFKRQQSAQICPRTLFHLDNSSQRNTMSFI
jgi:hypothetical protein